MKWATREYSKVKIDRAGEALLSGEVRDDALEMVNNWRSCHAFPLNTFQTHLRRMARHVDNHALVAQRIKRLSSIELKLRRFPTMTLSQMQDLGGCRAIVSDAVAVVKLARMYEKSRIKHQLHTLDNYIDKPQASGYRGMHLIYRYYSDRSKTYNGQKIEMQLRSQLQHAWATTVETVGMFTRHALKSSIGPERWLRFFALMGSVIAIREGTRQVVDTPGNGAELVSELREIASEIDVVSRLMSYSAALTSASENASPNDGYFLVQLNLDSNETSIQGFAPSELDRKRPLKAALTV